MLSLPYLGYSRPLPTGRKPRGMAKSTPNPACHRGPLLVPILSQSGSHPETGATVA